MAASVGPVQVVKQAQISSWFCSCCWIKQTFPNRAPLLWPSSCPHGRGLCLCCSWIPLAWVDCWSLNLSPDRSVWGGGIFDKAAVIKNVLLFHFVLFFFICASQPSHVCQTTVVHCTQEDVLHPSRAMGGWFLVSLAWSLGYLSHGCCNHGHCSVRHRWGSGSWLFLYLQCHSWLEWGGEDVKDVDGHEDFKEAKDSCGPKYVFTADLWNSISECEFPLFPKLDWIER